MEIAIEKMMKMHQLIVELQEFKPDSYEQYTKDVRTKYAIERLIQLVVGLALGVSSVLLAEQKRPPAIDDYNAFIDLTECGILEMEFAQAIASSASLRNKLDDAYGGIDDQLVYDSIDLLISMYLDYLGAVITYIKRV